MALAADFPETTAERWRASVEKVLARGRELTEAELDARFEATLRTDLGNGVVLSPLYPADDAPRSTGVPGSSPFTRGSSVVGATQGGWQVRQRVPWQGSPTQTSRALLTEISQGATALWLDAGTQAITSDELATALAEIDLETVPLALGASPLAEPGSQAALAGALSTVWQQRGLDERRLRGSLGMDPYGRAARLGGALDIDVELAATARLARRTCAAQAGIRTLVVDATVFHDAGADVVDELGLSIATGVAYLRVLVDSGLSVDQALAQLEFRYAATDNQFETIAKLRAARRMWARVADECGAGQQAGAQYQHAVTSRAMLTRYDPWVNLLRGTVACFAAGVGGAAAVTVLPYDFLTGQPRDAESPDADLGARLARNTQTVLIEESHLGRVIDPAGGSGFVESFTEDLAARAWEYLQQLESAGGMYTALTSGAVGDRLAATRDRARDRIGTRKQPITGVSEFPTLDDQPVREPGAEAAPAGAQTFVPLTPVRLAEPFEVLRDRALAHQEATGEQPRVFLANLGPPAEHSTRATFITNLFATGGIRAIDPGSVDAATVGQAVTASDAALVCICGTDERYEAEGVDVLNALTEADPARVYLAGNPPKAREALSAAGVEEFVVSGSDLLDLLDRALDAAGVA